ncbi:DUF4923 family protein [Chryseobacterium suipulveris]|uniref:DUF4923 family protein n=1 Tax=Chryseobacterium suipulveris TaxID=2929800 RepID=A0ABY4BTK3_9FLAO|nr:DUF4923 family protein [Chryseobacterium suipulveris]UOE42219.1 DUF4923 family protein [Chryseobacterium suipulveris]
MKTNLLILLFTIFLLSCMTSKNSENVSVLFKRWKIDYVELNNQKMEEFGKEEGSMEYEFKKDNTYTVYDNGTESNGKWEFNVEEKSVYFQNPYGEIEGKVTAISKDKIILIPTTKIGKHPELEIVKFHYKPK